MRYFISLSYRGSSYCGWQIQVNDPSVQSEVERAFSVYLKSEIKVTGAGRTDTGVHASNYMAHFDSPEPIQIQDYSKLIYKINAILPADITLLNIFSVADDAHARFDAVSRTYKYYIHTSKDSFAGDFSYFFPYKIDLAAMNLAASYLLGEKDFTSMAKLHSDVKTNICNVSEAFWATGSPLSLDCSDSSYCFTISANRFLRNMVRAIVGSLLDVGRGKLGPESVLEILGQKDRSAAGISAPAHALFLTAIEYPYLLK